MRSIITFTILCTGIIGSLFAADIPLRFSSFDMNASLPDPTAKAVFKDAGGILWVGTISGMVRYDGTRIIPPNLSDSVQKMLREAYIFSIKASNEQDIWISTFGEGLVHYSRTTGVFTSFTHEPDNPHSLPSNEVTSIAFGPKGEVWASTTNGLALRKPGDSHFQPVPLTEASSPLRSNYLYDLATDKQGAVWICSNKGLDKLVPEGEAYSIRAIGPESDSLNGLSILSLFIDEDGAIWLGVVVKGLAKLNPSSGEIVYFPHPEGDKGVQVNDIYRDEHGMVWLAMRRKGLARLDPKTKKYESYRYESCDEEVIGSDQINTIFKGSGDVWWVAHNQGLSYFFPYNNHLKGAQVVVEGLEGKEVAWPQAIARGPDGTMYIGTNRGIFSRKNEAEFSFLVDPRSLRNKANIFPLHCLFVSSDNSLWVGNHFYGPTSYNLKTGETRVLDIPRSGNLTQFLEDPEGNIWFVIDGKGLYRWHKGIDSVQRFIPESYEKSGDLVRFLCFQLNREKTGFWISGVNTGIFFFDLTSESFSRHIKYDTERRGFKACVDMRVGEDGKLWLATLTGLVKIDPESGDERIFTKNNGLIDHKITSMEFDKAGKLWFGTKKGLSCFDIANKRFRHYNKRDGLVDNFILNRGIRLEGDRLIVLTSEGISSIELYREESEETASPIVLTGFEVLNEPYALGADPTLVREIAIDHDDYTFSFFFGMPKKSAGSQLQYAYQLEGLDENWIETGSRNVATFTSLPPDDYVFNVKSMSDPAATPLRVKLHIKAAFWQTGWFKGLVFLLLAGLLAAFIWLGKKQLDARQKARLAQQSAQYKSQFLANMSHEIRTPLHAVLGAADLISRTDLSQNQSQYVHHIRRSGKHLMGLLDDVLDFSKIEANKLELHPVDFELEEILTYVEEAVKPQLVSNGCELSIQRDDMVPASVHGDRVRLGQILINLINNAAQHAPGGEVILEVAATEKAASGGYEFNFSVRDNGFGIPEDEVGEVFTSFYQASNKPLDQAGTGLGLAITKALVEQQGGSIVVKSKLGEGTTFWFNIPYGKTVDSSNQSVESMVSSEQLQLGSILMVEDMVANRELGSDMLQQTFPSASIHLAEDGFKALELLERQGLPDLILMDIRMPGMDGLTCTSKIREQYGSMVPILALSASATRREQDHYLQAGLDALLAKPFTPAQLTKAIYELMHIQDSDSLHIDFEQLNQFLGNDEDRLSRYLKTVRGEIRKHADNLRLHLAHDRWSQAQVSAHSLKTSFSYLGIPALSEAAKKIELACQEGQSEAYSQHLTPFIKQIRAFFMHNASAFGGAS